MCAWLIIREKSWASFMRARLKPIYQRAKTVLLLVRRGVCLRRVQRPPDRTQDSAHCKSPLLVGTVPKVFPLPKAVETFHRLVKIV